MPLDERREPPIILDFSGFELLTFDCYGTLIDWATGILSTLRRILDAHAKKIADVTLLELYGDFEHRSEQEQFQKYRQVLAAVVRQFGEHLRFTPTIDEESSLADSLPTWPAWPDTVKALRHLNKRFRLVILSNIDNDLFETTRPKLEVDFDEVVTSEQARAYKPSAKLFELALSRINVSAHKILHVGQSIYHDVIPAQSFGMGAVWVNRPSARPGVGAVKAAVAKPDLEVSSLAELARAAITP